MAQRFMTLQAGLRKLVEAITSSAGAGDAGKIPALDNTGRLDESFMPLGVGADTIAAVASEALAAGKFVNLFDNAGTFSARLADNSNGRPAHGYVKTALSISDPAVVYPLDGVNANMSALTIGATYWLGTAGGVIATPLDETDVANAGKISQMIGIAKSATELVTTDSDPVTL